MSCLCDKTERISACCDTLNIGTIADFDTEIYIYVQDNTTGRIEVQTTFGVDEDGNPEPLVSGAAGEVALDMSQNQDFYLPTHDYTLWVTLADAPSMDVRETITIDTVEYDCISPVFARCIIASTELPKTIAEETVVIA